MLELVRRLGEVRHGQSLACPAWRGCRACRAGGYGPVTDRWRRTCGATGSSVVLLSWGDNSSGELGNGNTTNTSMPSAVSLPPGVTPTAVSGGGGLGDPQPSQYAAYAIGSDGNLYAWGDNSRGALGNGTTANSSTPVVVSLPSGVTPTAISAAQGSGYAMGSDGHLYAWGDNTYGTLGNGTSVTFSDTPVLVSLPTGVTADAVSGGYESAYAIGSDGNLYAWGDNFYGELGNGGATNSDTPVAVSLPSGVTPQAIAGGGGTGYAIGSDGNLYAWGLNASGQLGNGSTTNSPSPVVVSLPSGVTPTAIAGAGGFAYAIGSDGHLYAWGNDSGGQLGNGSTTNSSVPVVVQLPSGVTPKAISGNYYVGYAIGSDGNLYAWGGNGSGRSWRRRNDQQLDTSAGLAAAGQYATGIGRRTRLGLGLLHCQYARRCALHRDQPDEPVSHHRTGRIFLRCGQRHPGPHGAVAGLDRWRTELLSGLGSNKMMH